MTAFTISTGSKDSETVVAVEGACIDCSDVQGDVPDHQGVRLCFRFTKEGLIADLLDEEGNVVRSSCQMYHEFIDSMREA